MHPLLDVTSLTDAQLLDKIAVASARIMAVRVTGQSFEIVNQLKLVMFTCQDELMRRNEPKQETDKVAWDMDSYLEQNKNASRDKEQEDLPRWKSKALTDLGADSDSPWD